MGIDKSVAIGALNALMEDHGELSDMDLFVLIEIRNMLQAEYDKESGHDAKMPEAPAKKEEKEKASLPGGSDTLFDKSAYVIGYTIREGGTFLPCHILLCPVGSLMTRMISYLNDPLTQNALAKHRDRGSSPVIGLHSMITSNGLRWDLRNGWHLSCYTKEELEKFCKGLKFSKDDA